MATTAPAGTTITFTEGETAALRALLYALRDRPTIERMNREFAMGMGGNHIDSIVELADTI